MDIPFTPSLTNLSFRYQLLCELHVFVKLGASKGHYRVEIHVFVAINLVVFGDLGGQLIVSVNTVAINHGSVRAETYKHHLAVYLFCKG